MEQEERVDIENCCTHYQIEINFFNSLEEAGLIHVQSEEGHRYISNDDLNLLERFIRLHYDLNINIEGLEAIHHMLERMSLMQQEIAMLRRK